MKYFFEGNEISINDIQSAAVESLMTVEEYINKFNIEVVEEEPVNQNEDFQQAPQEETALVGPVEQTPAVDTVSVSEDTSLELQETEEKPKKTEEPDPKKQLEDLKLLEEEYKAWQKGKSAQEIAYSKESENYQIKIDEAKQGLFFNQDEEVVVQKLKELAPSIVVGQTGSRDVLVYYDPVTNEKRNINLNADPVKAQEAIIALIEAENSLSSRDRATNAILANTDIFDWDVFTKPTFGQDLNTSLEGSGLQIKYLSGDGSREQFEISRDGEVIDVIEGRQNVVSWYKQNLTEKDLAVAKENSYQAQVQYSKLLNTEEGRIIERLDDKKNTSKLFKEYYETSFYKDLMNKVNSSGNFTTEEIDTLEKHFDQQKQKRDERQVDKDALKMSYKSENIPTTPTYTDEEYINITRDLTGLPEDLINKLLENNIYDQDATNQFEGEQLLSITNQYVGGKLNTFAERTLIDGGVDQQTLALGVTFDKVEEQEFKKGKSKQAEGIVAYEQSLDDIYYAQLEEISKRVPQGTEIKLQKIGGNTIVVISNDRNLTGAEADTFKQAQLDILEWQNSYNIYNTDLNQAKKNYIQSIVEYQDSKSELTNQYVNVFDVVNKEYDLDAVLAKDINDATAGIFLAVPTLFNSEWAINEQKKLNQKNQTFETMQSFDEATSLSQFLRFGSRTLAQQAPNIALAVGTAGAGNALGLSTALTETVVASSFGLTSGAQKYRDLNIQQEIVKSAKEQLEVLDWALKSGQISQQDYDAQSLDLNKTIATNYLSDSQIIGASIASGLIEGGVTRMFGTVPNSSKVIKDITGAGSAINPINFLYKTNLQKFGISGKELLKRTGGEILEEEAIYFGDTAISEGLILGREMDFSQWDDTLITSLMTSGAMNGPGIAYGTLLSNNVSTDFESQVRELNADIKGLVYAVNNTTDQGQKDLLLATIAEKMGLQSQAVDGLAVDVIALGAENQEKIIAYNMILNSTLEKAGVVLGDTQEQVDQKTKDYIESLKREGKNTEAENFENEVSLLNRQINQVKDPSNLDYTRVEENFGEVGKLIDKNLKENNANGYNSKSKQQQLAVVLDKIRNKVVDQNIAKAKSNPQVVATVNAFKEMSKSRGESFTKQQEDALYNSYGKQLLTDRSKAISVAIDVDTKANEILREDTAANLQIIKASNKNELDLEVQRLLDNNEITLEQAQDIYDGFEKEAFGFITGNKYIVRDEAKAKERLDQGMIQQGTVILHEMSHSIDNKAFTEAEMSEYAINLQKAMSESDNNNLVQIDAIVTNLLNNMDKFKDDSQKSFKERSIEYQDEYTKITQEYLYADNNKLNLEKEASLYKKITSKLGIGVEINTPEKALEYVLAHNHAFRSGKRLSSLAAARVRKSKGRVVEGTQLSEQSRIKEEINALYANATEEEIYSKEFEEKILQLSKQYDQIGKTKKELTPQELDEKNKANLKVYLDPKSTQQQKTKAAEDILNNNKGLIYNSLGYSVTKGDIDPQTINSEAFMYLVGNEALAKGEKGRYGRGILNTFDDTKNSKLSSYIGERFKKIKAGLYQDLIGRVEEETIVSIDSGNVKQIMAEENNYNDIDVTNKILNLIDPFNLFTTVDENGKTVQDTEFREKFKQALKQKLETLSIEELQALDYAQMYNSDIVPLDILAEYFDIPADRLTDKQRNLQKKDPVKEIQRWIFKNADTLIRLMQKGNTEVGNLGTKISSRILQKEFYNKQDKKINNQIQYKLKPGIKRADYLQVHGVVGSKIDATFIPYRDQQAQAIKGTLEMTGRNLTSLMAREIIDEMIAEQKLTEQEGTKAKMSMGSGKSENMFSMVSQAQNQDGEIEILDGKLKTVKLSKNQVDTFKNNISLFAEAYANSNFNFEKAYNEVYGEKVFGKKSFIVKGWFENILNKYRNIGIQENQSIEEYLNSKLLENVDDGDGVMLVSGVPIKYINDDGTFTQTGEKVIDFAKNILDQEIKAAVNNEDKIQAVQDFYLTWGYILKAGGKFINNNTKLFENVIVDVLEKNNINVITKTAENKIKGTNISFKKYESSTPTIILNQSRVKSKTRGWTTRTKVGYLNTNKEISNERFISFSIKNDPTIAKNKYQSINNIKSWNEQAQKAEDVFKKQIQQILDLNDVEIATAFLDLSLKDMKSPLKLFPKIKFYEKGLTSNESITYEHTLPSSYLARTLMSYFVGDTSADVLNKVIDSSYVSIVSKATNNKLNKEYKQTMPEDYKPGDDPIIRMEKSGVDMQKDFINVQNPQNTLKNFSEVSSLSQTFNGFIENVTDIPADKVYSKARAEMAGRSRGKNQFFIPPSAEDLVGLLYQTLAKGKEGEKQMAWYDLHITKPFARAMSQISADRVYTAQKYKDLKKELGIIPKNLKNKIEQEDFTYEQAVRIYIWFKQGYDIPGLDKKDVIKFKNIVAKDPLLKEFADKLIDVNGSFDYAKPVTGWVNGTITTDLLETLNTTKRAEYLKQWQKNVDEIFSEENLNKLEAAYGSEYRYALENILTRMKTGRNKMYGTDNITGRIDAWLTNSIGTIMFLNTRSAILQTISASNFINWSDNNPFMAAAAFANQPQYWKDFIMLFNSDFLKDRRQGLRLEVNEADLADLAKESGVRGVISRILKAGFTPTQLADSFAIASGGATFYRNRLKRYLKEGIDQELAEEMAMRDFRETAEESQQSSRPDKISAQQASAVGKYILAFANTPAQYARLTKKAFLDLKNGRGDAKTNISKIIYYNFVQNLIFNGLQQALEALMFDDEDDEELTPQEKEEARIKKEKDMQLRVANGMADSILRGIGVQGAILSVIKNVVLRGIKESEKDRPEYAEALTDEMLKISPPISSKYRNIKNGIRSYDFNKDVMYEMGYNLDNPAYLGAADVISGLTNLPLDRLVLKVQNINAALTEDLNTAQKIALLGGWSKYNLGIKDVKIKEIKERLKSERAQAKKDETRKKKQERLDTLLKMNLEERSRFLEEERKNKKETKSQKEKRLLREKLLKMSLEERSAYLDSIYKQ
jgi:hypothetical protein